MAIHHGRTGHRRLTDHEKREFYGRLARLRVTLEDTIRPVCRALGGARYAGPGDPGDAIARVQAITVVMKVLEAMRTEAVYEAGTRGAGYPDIGAAAGISRQAARQQWPNAVYTKAMTRRCQLSSYLTKHVPSLPDIDCDDQLGTDYRLDYKLAPAGVHVRGCLTHTALYRELLGRSALVVVRGWGEKLTAPKLLADSGAADPVKDVLQAQAEHGNVVAMRELAWRFEIDQAKVGPDVQWFLQAAAERGDRYAARAWARHLEHEGQLHELINLWEKLAATGDRFACTELSDIHLRLGHHGRAAMVWQPLAATGDGFALRAFAETLPASMLVDGAIPVFRRAYTHLRKTEPAMREPEGWREACHALIDRLIEEGHDHQALSWLRLTARGDPQATWALDELTWRLERVGQLDEAEAWLREAVDLKVPDAPKKLHGFLVRIGRTDEAETLVCDPSLSGLATTQRQLRQHLKDADLSVFANALLAEGNAKELAEHAREFENVGDVDGAVTMWRAAAEADNYHARWEAIRLLDGNGRGDEAETWLRDLIRAGQTPIADTERADSDDLPGFFAQVDARRRARVSARQAARVLATLLERHGRKDEALTLLRRASDEGDKYAAQDLRTMLSRSRYRS